MAQSDYNIANDSAPAVRAKLNTVFESIATNNAGASAPSTTFPHQWWYDATTNILKQRNAADDAWIDIGQFDQTAGTFQPIGTPQLTQVQVEDDTDTTFGTVSGERLAQASAASISDFASGAAGSPRLGLAALPEVAAGTQVKLAANATISTTSASYVNDPLDIFVLQSGVVRVTFQHRRGDGTSEARVMRNGTEISAWSTSSNSFQSRSADVTVAIGDRVRIQHRATGLAATPVSEIRNRRVQTDGAYIFPIINGTPLGEVTP
jgi:hypothetical protein